jgi:predicted nucleic acid-binding protein
MIIVDTNVIIDFWRNSDKESAIIFNEFDVYICGIVKAELLHGARNNEYFNDILESLSYFPELKIYDLFWDDLGKNLFLLKKNGLTMPIQDVMIMTLAIHFNFIVWTNDKHFKFAQTI